MHHRLFTAQVRAGSSPMVPRSSIPCTLKDPMAFFLLTRFSGHSMKTVIVGYSEGCWFKKGSLRDAMPFSEQVVLTPLRVLLLWVIPSFEVADSVDQGWSHSPGRASDSPYGRKHVELMIVWVASAYRKAVFLSRPFALHMVDLSLIPSSLSESLASYPRGIFDMPKTYNESHNGDITGAHSRKWMSNGMRVMIVIRLKGY